MALLTPNSTYKINGVLINEKIIPYGTRWKDSQKAVNAGFTPNSLYKKDQKLTGSSGKPIYITIHNTNDLENVYDDGEQYTRATYNENMGSARVHFYVDDVCAWQNLKAGTGMSANDPEGSAEVSWHAGDGSIDNGGNMTSLSIEIIMNDTPEHDTKAKDNGARLAAWLLWKHNIPVTYLVTHTYWVNKIYGSKFDDIDIQCTTPISGQKWCPSYIFASNNANIALRNWISFKNLVNHYLVSLNSVDKIVASNKATLQEGALVQIADNAVYYNGKSVPQWVKNQKWYIKSVTNDRAVIDKNESKTNSICSPISTKYLKAVKDTNKPLLTPYLVKVITKDLKIYKNAGDYTERMGTISDFGVYTIVEETTEQNGSKWGKLKSGAGWINLEFTKRV